MGVVSSLYLWWIYVVKIIDLIVIMVDGIVGLFVFVMDVWFDGFMFITLYWIFDMYGYTVELAIYVFGNDIYVYQVSRNAYNDFSYLNKTYVNSSSLYNDRFFGR